MVASRSIDEKAKVLGTGFMGFLDSVLKVGRQILNPQTPAIVASLIDIPAGGCNSSIAAHGFSVASDIVRSAQPQCSNDDAGGEPQAAPILSTIPHTVAPAPRTFSSTTTTVMSTPNAAFPAGFFTQPVSSFVGAGVFFSVNGKNESHTVALRASWFVPGAPSGASPQGKRAYINSLALKSVLDNKNPGYGGVDVRCEGLQMNTITWAKNEFSLLIGPFSAEEMMGPKVIALHEKLEELAIGRRRLQLIVALVE